MQHAHAHTHARTDVHTHTHAHTHTHTHTHTHSGLQGTGILLAVTTIYQYSETIEKEADGSSFSLFNPQL